MSLHVLMVMAMFLQVDQPQLFHVHEVPEHGGGMAVPRAHSSRENQSGHLQLPIWIGLKVVWKVLGAFIDPG